MDKKYMAVILCAVCLSLLLITTTKTAPPDVANVSMVTPLGGEYRTGAYDMLSVSEKAYIERSKMNGNE